MKFHSFLMLTIGIATIVLIVLVLTPKATTLERLDALNAQQAHSPDAGVTYQNGLYIKTIKHDGHTFVTAQTGSSYGAASIIHHPDCACFSRPKER